MSDSLTQSPDWLDLRAIESITQIPYSTLRPYAALEILQQALGAAERPGVRGVRWPASSLSTWLQLAEAIRRKTVQPGTVKAWLKERGLNTETALVPLAQSAVSQSLNESLTHYGEDALSLLSAILETLNHQQVQTDALLTMKQAHAETGIPYAILRTFRVQVGRRYFVKRSECLRWIASLGK